MKKSDNEIRKKYNSGTKINEDSYFSEPEEDNMKKFNNLKINKKNNKFGKEKRNLDRFVLYKGMENLNDLEHKFHQDRDDKAVSSVKFNFRYHNIKRQLYFELFVCFKYLASFSFDLITIITKCLIILSNKQTIKFSI